MARLLRIGELAEATGVSTRSLRYYESQGLLRSTRCGNGWRAYEDRAVDRVVRIQHLYAAGLSSGTIREILPCLDSPPEERNSFLTHALDEQVARLQAERQRLDRELDVLVALRDAETDPDAPPAPVGISSTARPHERPRLRR